jgi:hypothetical protein
VERPVAYASRVLESNEQHYSVGEKEALACICGAEHFHFYLFRRRFLIRTDHSSLTSLLSTAGTGRRALRIHRWYDRLLPYDYVVRYRPGKDNALPDLLSRCTGPKPVTTGTVQTSDDVYAVGQLDELDFISAIAVTEATVKDDLLTQVIKHVQTGFTIHTVLKSITHVSVQDTRVYCVT